MSGQQRAHKNIPHIQLPKFEPLPPDKWYNRAINNMLKPLFYLVFTLVVSIFVIPVYTVIENMKDRSHSSHGQPKGHTAYTVNGHPVESGETKAEHFLRDFGQSYGTNEARERKR